MIKKEHQCNLGYFGHCAQLVKDKDGTPMVLSIGPMIRLVPMETYELLLDEMMDTMSEYREDWIHWQDNWITEVGLDDD